jgi:hypothetical protein
VCKYDAVEGSREIPIVSPFLWAFWEEKKKMRAFSCKAINEVFLRVLPENGWWFVHQTS